MTAVDMRRVRALMTAFAYGGRVDDLSAVDARHNSGQYDDVQWHVALDGATLHGFDAEYRRHLVESLRRGLTEAEAETMAYTLTATTNGFTV